MSDRRTYLIREDVKRVTNGLGQNPDIKQRCVTAVAKQILLDGDYFYNGTLIKPTAKSIGAGVWEVSHKEDTTDGK